MVKVHINEAVLRRLLESKRMDAARKRAGDAIADNVRGMGIDVGDLNADGTGTQIALPVEVDDQGGVVIAHPAGVAVQAKHGALTRAAAAAGLEVKS